jgi:MFS family permease
MREPGKQEWGIVAVLFVTMFFIWGPINASSVFFLPVVKHFGWSRAFFSLLVATAPLAAGFSSPVIGTLIDRYGARGIMTTGATMVALSFIALSRANSPAAFLAIFVVLGAGVTASTIIPAAVIITRAFREQRGLALGIAFAGIPLGGTGIAIFANQMVKRAGFRAGYFSMALPILFVVIPLLAIFMRSAALGETTESGESEAELPGLEVRDALRSRSFWMIAIAEVLFAIAGVGLRVHLVPLLTGVGYSPTFAAEILGAMFVFNAIGTFAIGPIVDRLGGRATLSLVFLIAGAGIAALLGGSHLIAVATFILIFGLVGETPSAIFPIAVTESLGARRLGGLLGLFALCRTFGFAAGPVIAGRIFDQSGSYAGALILFIAAEVISMIAIRATLPISDEQVRASPLPSPQPARSARREPSSAGDSDHELTMRSA